MKRECLPPRANFCEKILRFVAAGHAAISKEVAATDMPLQDYSGTTLITPVVASYSYFIPRGGGGIWLMVPLETNSLRSLGNRPSSV
jgi:hypothetical protein